MRTATATISRFPITGRAKCRREAAVDHSQSEKPSVDTSGGESQQDQPTADPDRRRPGFERLSGCRLCCGRDERVRGIMPMAWRR
jgi:hypothetical protein